MKVGEIMKKCPICKKELDKKETHPNYKKVFCDNKCFELFISRHSRQYKIFNDEFIILAGDNLLYRLKVEFKVRRKIRYWKKNDRYLMELLTK
jgi:endogenous inhibitor of DNA gyrase (YacG/DUF329 family)